MKLDFFHMQLERLDPAAVREKYLRRGIVKNTPRGDLDVITQRGKDEAADDNQADTLIEACLAGLANKDAPKQSRKLGQKLVDELRDADVVKVPLRTAILVMDEVERFLIEDSGFSVQDILGKRIEHKNVAEYYRQLKEEATDGPYIRPLPVVFTFGGGVYLHDIEAAYRGFADNSAKTKHRVLLCLYLGRALAVELGTMADTGVLEPVIFAHERQWMNAPTILPWVSHILVALAHWEQPKPERIEKGFRKGKKLELRHFTLHTTQDIGAFVRRYFNEGEAMRKETVFDNIPCLTMHMGLQGPQVVIECDTSGCDYKEHMRVKRLGEGPDLYLQHFKKGGWKIKGDGKKAICKSCQKKSRRKQQVNGEPKVGRRIEVPRVEAQPSKPNPPVKKPEQQPIPLLSDVAEAKPRSRGQLMDEIVEVLSRSATPLAPKAICNRLKNTSLDVVNTTIGRLKKNGRVRRVERGYIVTGGTKTHSPTIEKTQTKTQRNGKRMPRSYTIEFKREIVETAVDLSPSERSRYLKEQGIHYESFRSWRKKYAKGELGKIAKAVPVTLRGSGTTVPRKGRDRRRHFSEEFKREVVETAANLDLQERDEYMRSLDLELRYYTMWKKKFSKKGTKRAPMSKKLDTKTQFQLFGLFQEHIDQDAMAYEDGWSDERCAKELGLDIDTVIAVREDAIGKVKNPQAEEAKRKMEEITSKFKKDFEDMQAMMEDMKSTYEQQMAELRSEIEDD